MGIDEGPRLIDLRTFGEASSGLLTLAALANDIPFEVERVFWTYDTPPGVTRGNHAHRRTKTVLVAVTGIIVVSTELPSGECRDFTLDEPTRALYLPPLCWRTMTYTSSAVQIAFESHDYSEKDYITSLEDLRRIGIENGRRR